MSFWGKVGKSIQILFATLFGWWLGSMLLSFVTFGLGQLIFDEETAMRITQWAVYGLLVLALLVAIAGIADVIKPGKQGGSTS